MEIHNLLTQKGNYLLVYRIGYYEPSYELKKYETEQALLDEVNKLNSETDEVLVLFAGEIKREFNIEPEQVVTKFKLS